MVKRRRLNDKVPVWRKHHERRLAVARACTANTPADVMRIIAELPTTESQYALVVALLDGIIDVGSSVEKLYAELLGRELLAKREGVAREVRALAVSRDSVYF